MVTSRPCSRQQASGSRSLSLVRPGTGRQGVEARGVKAADSTSALEHSGWKAVPPGAAARVDVGQPTPPPPLPHSRLISIPGFPRKRPRCPESCHSHVLGQVLLHLNPNKTLDLTLPSGWDGECQALVVWAKKKDSKMNHF